MKPKIILAAVLLAFVAVSVCYALAKPLLAVRHSETARDDAPALTDRADVYYFHGNVRCTACLAVQAAASELVRGEFAQQRQAGRLTWHEANFEQDPDLAKRYGVAASTVVVVTVRDGKQSSFQRLDDVFRYAANREQLANYIRPAIAAALPGGAGVSPAVGERTHGRDAHATDGSPP